jgi:hypothetical protein
MRRLAHRNDVIPLTPRQSRKLLAPPGLKALSTDVPVPVEVMRRPAATVDLELLRHELRTPLTGMLGLAELLAATDLPSRAACWLSTLQACGEQLANLIDRALKSQPAGRSNSLAGAFDGARFLESLVMAHWPAAQSENTQLALVCSAAARTVWHTDAVLLRQALDNLLANAIRFSRGGQVLLEARVVPQPGGECNQLELAVENFPAATGPACSNLQDVGEFADRTYRMYSRGHGLQVVDSACQRLGGKLLQNRVDAGSTRFAVLLQGVIRQPGHQTRRFKPALLDRLGCILLLEPARERCVSAMLACLEITFTVIGPEQLPRPQSWPNSWILVTSQSGLLPLFPESVGEPHADALWVVGCAQAGTGPELVRYRLPCPWFQADLQNILLRCRVEVELTASARLS